MSLFVPSVRFAWYIATQSLLTAACLRYRNSFDTVSFERQKKQQFLETYEGLCKFTNSQSREIPLRNGLETNYSTVNPSPRDTTYSNKEFCPYRKIRDIGPVKILLYYSRVGHEDRASYLSFTCRWCRGSQGHKWSFG